MMLPILSLGLMLLILGRLMMLLRVKIMRLLLIRFRCWSFVCLWMRLRIKCGLFLMDLLMILVLIGRGRCCGGWIRLLMMVERRRVFRVLMLELFCRLAVVFVCYQIFDSATIVIGTDSCVGLWPSSYDVLPWTGLGDCAGSAGCNGVGKMISTCASLGES